MAIRCHLCHGGSCLAGPMQECIARQSCYKSTTLVSEGDKIPQYTRGCDDNGFMCTIMPSSTHINIISRTQVKCCSTNLCNNGTFPKLATRNNTENSEGNNFFLTSPNLYIFFGAFMFLALSFLIFVFIYKKCSPKKAAYSSNHSHTEKADPVETEYLNSDYKPEVKVSSPGDSTLREMLDGSEVTSGSGSGFPLLVQRTLAKQIDLIDCIGKGRYGEVWKGNFHYDEVAVKIFYSRDEASWQREVEIYSTIILKNENILPFIGSDVTSVNSCTQLWLVTTYYKLGSLFDFLSLNTLNFGDMYSIMISIVTGIAHLHTEVFGTQGKPAIAHRDIKSKNILMKTPYTCCIADFGLAVTHKQTGPLNIAFNYRVGTKRYMAPEVLDGTLQENSFQSYTMADIYSLSLVLWEIIRRTESETHTALSYNVPYQDMVPSDPSFDEMRNMVCIENRRPEIDAEIENNPTLNGVANIIRETWCRAPKSRLSALRIKKSLTNMEHVMLKDKS